MAKLYFKYGAMGSSKTAQALITKYNYEENGLRVWLLKPSTDDRDGAGVVQSRIGLKADAEVIGAQTDLYEVFSNRKSYDVIIVDECQFLPPEQIDQLRRIVDEYNVPVLCFGLRIDFRKLLFPGSRRLFEIADNIEEIKTICDCGAKATTNARVDANGYIVTEGSQILIGGNDCYIAMCHRCYEKNIREHRKIKLHSF